VIPNFIDECWQGHEFLNPNCGWEKDIEIVLNGNFNIELYIENYELDRMITIFSNVWKGVFEAYGDEYDFHKPMVYIKYDRKQAGIKIKMRLKPEEVSK
jgi:hypothetical protein